MKGQKVINYHLREECIFADIYSGELFNKQKKFSTWGEWNEML